MNTPRSIKPRRGFHGGPETQMHRDIKQTAGLMFSLHGWGVFAETGHADLVACTVNGGEFRLVSVEVELQATRHVAVNVRRDLRNGSQLVLIVTTTPNLCAAIERQLDRALDRETRQWVVVTTIAEIRRGIEEITNRSQPQPGNESKPPDNAAMRALTQTCSTSCRIPRPD
jgi:hypothetical protein